MKNRSSNSNPIKLFTAPMGKMVNNFFHGFGSPLLGSFAQLKTHHVMHFALMIACLLMAFARLHAQDVDTLMTQPKDERLDSAYLINNADSRGVDRKTGYMKGDLAALGRPVNPSDIIVIASSTAPDVAVELYRGIKKLPDFADAIRIQYRVSKDGKSAQFIGYILERPMDIELATVKYDGPLAFRLDDAKPWIDWIEKSFLDDPTKKKTTK